jgi:hypothetical protein
MCLCDTGLVVPSVLKECMDPLNQEHITKYLNPQVYHRRNLKFEGILVLNHLWFLDISVINCVQWRTLGVWGFNPPPRNSEVLTKLSQNPSSAENTSVTT